MYSLDLLLSFAWRPLLLAYPSSSLPQNSIIFSAFLILCFSPSSVFSQHTLGHLAFKNYVIQYALSPT